MLRRDEFDFLRPECLFTIMTGATVHPGIVVRFRNASSPGLHGEADIDMTKSACVLRPMQPVLEDDGSHFSFFRKIIDHHIAVFIQLGPFLLYSKGMNVRKKYRQEQYGQHGNPDEKQTFICHFPLPRQENFV